MGKTTLIRQIIRKKTRLNPYLNVYHVDTKKRGDFNASDGTMIISDIAPDVFKTPGNRMVWQVLHDNKEQYNKFYKAILDAGIPSIVNIDESANMKFGDVVPRELELLLLQGRAAGIHVISGTQQIAKSPREMASQATYLISFNLTQEYDEKTALRRLELTQKKLGLRKGQFYYLDTDIDMPAKKFNSYQEFLPLVH